MLFSSFCNYQIRDVCLFVCLLLYVILFSVYNGIHEKQKTKQTKTNKQKMKWNEMKENKMLNTDATKKKKKGKKNQKQEKMDFFLSCCCCCCWTIVVVLLNFWINNNNNFHIPLASFFYSFDSISSFWSSFFVWSVLSNGGEEGMVVQEGGWKGGRKEGKNNRVHFFG